MPSFASEPPATTTTRRDMPLATSAPAMSRPWSGPAQNALTSQAPAVRTPANSPIALARLPPPRFGKVLGEVHQARRVGARQPGIKPEFVDHGATRPRRAGAEERPEVPGPRDLPERLRRQRPQQDLVGRIADRVLERAEGALQG